MNRLNALILSLLMMSVAISAIAQESDNALKFKVEGVSSDTIYLANYLGNKLYYNDTTYADAAGNFSFEGKSYEDGGKYAVVLPGPKYFDILVTGEPLEMHTTTRDMIGDMEVVQSEDNRIFFEYINFIREKQQERGPLEEVLNDSTLTRTQKRKAEKAFSELNNEVINYQKELIENHGDKLVGKMLKMTQDVRIPEEVPEGIEDTKQWQYNYYKNHYWDNTDLNDPRLVRDQQFHTLLDKYFNKVLPQTPDTICQRGPELAETVRGNEEMFKYVVHFITFNAGASKIMCMDKAFVCMVNKYYKTGEATWMKEDKLAELIESAESKENTLCGEVVPDITLPDTTGQNWVSLYDLNAEYTAIVIWESSCGHCKKEMPKLAEFYEKWKDKGVEVYAIGNEFENEDWMKFIRKKGLTEWINVSDNPEINERDSAMVLIQMGITNIKSLNFRSTFDVQSTPKIYLIDKDKKIVAKQLSTEQLDEMMTNLIGDGQARKEEE